MSGETSKRRAYVLGTPVSCRACTAGNSAAFRLEYGRCSLRRMGALAGSAFYSGCCGARDISGPERFPTLFRSRGWPNCCVLGRRQRGASQGRADALPGTLRQPEHALSACGSCRFAQVLFVDIPIGLGVAPAGLRLSLFSGNHSQVRLKRLGKCPHSRRLGATRSSYSQCISWSLFTGDL